MCWGVSGRLLRSLPVTTQDDKTPAGPVAEPATEAKKSTGLPWIVETLLIVLAVLFVVGLFQQFVGRQYVIPSGSMEPTLHGCEGCSNDRIFTEKVSYYGSDPQPGDVVVFEGTDSWNEMWDSPRSDNPAISTIQDGLSFLSLARPNENDLVKRVIATGGQTVSCQAGDPSIMVDGKPTDQSFVMDPPTYPVDEHTGSEACGGPYFGPITVPEGRYFMMGDNRTNSADSRFHMDDGSYGTIPRENIRGKVQFVFFPFNHIGGVDDPDIQG
ncbi:Signal peptidase I [Corynebacterium massiliense DSM 45435]|uniref:Signal peptidase I n=1 Tax=Corynebacterium massiliense DSM 45435 TaxID=1121364 RepID=A0ABY7U7S8_9CORY|nr:Signal peptidase I [Corynebacterium massiliense DSM 45435]